MKITNHYLAAAFLLLTSTGAMSQTQTDSIDLRTGIVNNTNSLIALGAPDDTWQVMIPGSTTYQQVFCSNGIFAGSQGSYSGHNVNIGWVSPYVNANGECENTGPMGDYLFKMNFNLEKCNIFSAVLEFEHIGADNFMNLISVNGNNHTVNYTFNPFTANVNIVLSNTELVPGSNEIIIRVHNLVPSYIGMEIKGQLKIVSGSTFSLPNPSFSLTPTSTGIQGSSTQMGTHTWAVYSAATYTGPYTFINNFSSPTFSANAGDQCYYVIHNISTWCGDACESQLICHSSCEESECIINPPVNLNFDGSSNTFTWDPVPNASSYIIEITVDDPACCGGGGSSANAPVSIPVNLNEYVLDYYKDLGVDGQACFSWRVIAICANGAQSVSETKCGGSGGEMRNNPTGSISGESKNLSLSVSPNPANDRVNFDLVADHDLSYNMEILDLSGKTVKVFSNLKTSGHRSNLSWSTSSLSRGTYMVKIVTSDNRTVNHKLVIE